MGVRSGVNYAARPEVAELIIESYRSLNCRPLGNEVIDTFPEVESTPLASEVVR